MPGLLECAGHSLARFVILSRAAPKNLFPAEAGSSRSPATRRLDTWWLAPLAAARYSCLQRTGKPSEWRLLFSGFTSEVSKNKCAEFMLVAAVGALLQV